MAFFKTYSFKNQANGHTENLTDLSYYGAAFLGPLYILFHGFWGRFLLHFLLLQPLMLLAWVLSINLAGATLGLDKVSKPVDVLLMLVSIAIYMVLMSKMTIWGVRKTYQRIGWQEVSS